MTTLIQDVQAALAPCVPTGGAWYCVNMREPPAEDGGGRVAPFIVWQRIASVDNVTLQGPSNLQNTRLQVDIFAPHVEDAESVRVAADAALAAAFGSKILPLSSQDVYEAPARLVRIIREYSLWR
jgi:hypothetical protein